MVATVLQSAKLPGLSSFFIVFTDKLFLIICCFYHLKTGTKELHHQLHSSGHGSVFLIRQTGRFHPFLLLHSSYSKNIHDFLLSLLSSALFVAFPLVDT